MRRPTLRSDTKPSVATIPERAVLTNERLYTRARLLTLAKVILNHDGTQIYSSLQPFTATPSLNSPKVTSSNY